MEQGKRQEQRYLPKSCFNYTNPSMTVDDLDRRLTRRKLNRSAQEEAMEHLYGVPISQFNDSDKPLVEQHDYHKDNISEKDGGNS